MAWQFDSAQPIYVQLVNRVKSDIISGAYAAGAKLPSVRELALKAAVNPNTVQKAYSELEASGLIIAQRGTGSIVTNDEDAIKALKLNYASELTSKYCSDMRGLGFCEEEISALMLKCKKEESNE